MIIRLPSLLMKFFLTSLFLGQLVNASTFVPKYFDRVAKQAGVDGRALYTLALINSRQQVSDYWVAWPWSIYDKGKVVKLKSQFELIRYIQNDPNVSFGLFALTLNDFEKHHVDTNNLAFITLPETQLRLVSKHFDAVNTKWLNQAATKLGVKSLSQSYSPIKVPKYVRGLEKIIYQKSRKYGVPTYLVKAVIRAESAYNPRAVSKAGALGLMQVMPDTAKGLGITNPRQLFNPEIAVDTGTRYLAMQLREFKSIPLALAAYNAGPSAVRKYNYTVPPYRETKNYVKIVQRYMAHYKRLEGV